MAASIVCCLPEPYAAYFETGKWNENRRRSPLSGMMDQIKGLRQYMDKIHKAYGLDNIDSGLIQRFGRHKVTPSGELINANDRNGNPRERRAELIAFPSFLAPLCWGCSPSRFPFQEVFLWQCHG